MVPTSCCPANSGLLGLGKQAVTKDLACNKHGAGERGSDGKELSRSPSTQKKEEGWVDRQLCPLTLTTEA